MHSHVLVDQGKAVQKSMIRFTENIQLVCGLIAAIMIVPLSNYTLEGMQFGGLSGVTMGHVAAGWMALWSLRSAGVSITSTSAALTRKALLGETRIKWAEMEKLEVGPFCMWLVFHGAGKRIWMRKPVSSLDSWFNKNEEHEDPLLVYLLDMAEEQGIPVESGFLTPFKTSRA